VYEKPFAGFVEQKNAAIALARADWILSIDADEIVTPALAGELLAISRATATESAYRIPRLTFYLGRWIRYGGWFPDFNVRFFKRGSGAFVGGTVHEQFRTSGTTGILQNPLLHYSYDRIASHVDRMNHYSDLIAQDKFKRGQRSTPLWALAKSVSKFILTYFYRLGFLDGRPGFVIAVLAAYYNFLKYIKLWELGQSDIILDRKKESRDSFQGHEPGKETGSLRSGAAQAAFPARPLSGTGP